MRVYLTGFSGAGKTTAGKLLAGRIGARFVDSDRMIEKKTGVSIPEIFRTSGERAFRKVEREVISGIVTGRTRKMVIALGGGAMQTPGVRRTVLKDGLVVYLSCSARELYRRVHRMSDRPLLNVNPRPGETVAAARHRRLGELLKARVPGYRQAHITLSTTRRSPSETAGELYHMIRRYRARH